MRINNVFKLLLVILYLAALIFGVVFNVFQFFDDKEDYLFLVKAISFILTMILPAVFLIFKEKIPVIVMITTSIASTALFVVCLMLLLLND